MRRIESSPAAIGPWRGTTRTAVGAAFMLGQAILRERREAVNNVSVGTAFSLTPSGPAPTLQSSMGRAQLKPNFGFFAARVLVR